MTHQTNAQRLADELGQGHPLEDTVAEASEELRRLSAIEQARDVAVEMAAQYAAERDQLRAQLAALAAKQIPSDTQIDAIFKEVLIHGTCDNDFRESVRKILASK